MVWNQVKIKRAASREARNSGHNWNPWKRVTWTNPPRERDPESGDNHELAHVQSAPEGSTGAEFHYPPEPAPSEQSTSPIVPATAQVPSSIRSRPTGRRTTEDSYSTAGPYPARVDEEEKEDVPKEKKQGIFKKCKPKEPFTIRNQIQRTLFGSWINILLVAAPAGIALDQIDSVSRVVVFVVNFIAIVPLAAMLGFATEEIALRTGETLGGLLNATFGNAVELIVAIMALVEGEVTIVQTSLIGSILSNLLLVLGMCFFCGGINRPHQNFNTTVAQTATSLLALAVASVIVPTVFDEASQASVDKVAKLSRGTSIILLVVYGAYLFFQLKTHSDVYLAESEKVAARPLRTKTPEKGVVSSLVGGAMVAAAHNNASDREQLGKMLMNPRALEEEEEEEPQLHFAVAVATLAISTVIIALCAEFMVSSIDSVTEGNNLSKEFVGLILLPIVGNAAEHATAITVAIKDKMDLAIGVAVGSSMQVALFLIPLLVVIGWIKGMDDMNLSFDVFQVAVLFVSVLLTNYLIADGKSHWLEGMLLVCLYCIIAVCAVWYPTEEDNNETAARLLM